MKKTLITLLALTNVAAASETYVFTLPSTQQIAHTTMGQTWDAMLATVDEKGYGLYAGGQQNYISTTGNNSWGTNGEGSWVLSDDGTGSVTLLGRSGVTGDGFALVLGNDIKQNTEFSSLTFNAAISSASSLGGSITLGLAITDNTGKVLASAGGNTLAVNSIGSTSQDLSFSENITWQEGYKIIAIIDGVSGTATTAYTVSGISVTGQVVPEPTTATLSLLALAGLAARRRRK